MPKNRLLVSIFPALVIVVVGSVYTVIYSQLANSNSQNIPKRPASAVKLETIGNSGMSVKLPVEFKKISATRHSPASHSHTLSESYRYQYNGVSVIVNYTDYNNIMVANESVHQELIQYFSASFGIDARSIEQKPVIISNLPAVEYQARYDVLPMAKQMIYQSVGIVDKSKVWMVTTSYKDCDNDGQSIAKAIIDSVKIQSTTARNTF